MILYSLKDPPSLFPKTYHVLSLLQILLLLQLLHPFQRLLILFLFFQFFFLLLLEGFYQPSQFENFYKIIFLVLLMLHLLLFHLRNHSLYVKFDLLLSLLNWVLIKFYFYPLLTQVFLHLLIFFYLYPHL